MLVSENQQNGFSDNNTVIGMAGQFIGIERELADIGLISLTPRGEASFTIDDFAWSPDPATPVPVPAAGMLLGAGLGVLGAWRRRSG